MNVNKVYTAREAAELWGYSTYTITRYCHRNVFKKEARKSKGIWLVTYKGMKDFTGREPDYSLLKKKGE